MLAEQREQQGFPFVEVGDLVQAGQPVEIGGNPRHGRIALAGRPRAGNRLGVILFPQAASPVELMRQGREPADAGGIDRERGGERFQQVGGGEQREGIRIDQQE